MTDVMDLHKLVKNSVRRGLPPKSFLYLFEQLDRRQPVSGKELHEYLMKFTNKRAFDNTVQQYILVVASSSSTRMEQFWANLVELEREDQKKHFRGLYDMIILKKPQPVAPELVSDVINLHFPKYFEQLIAKNATGYPDLVSLASTLWATLLDAYSSLVQSDKLKLFVIYIMAHKRFLREDVLEYLLSKSRPVLLASNVELPNHDLNSKDLPLDPNASSSLIRQLSGPITNMKKNTRLFEIKKYYWLLSSMKNWTFNQDNFLKDYEKFCMSKSQSHIVKKSYSLVYDITLSMFNGFAVSLISDEPPYILFNWNNFIITRLPHILASVKFLASTADTSDSSLETLEDAILNAFNALNESTVKAITALDSKTFSYTDLRQAFIKSCVYSGILATPSFHRFFPMEARTTQQMLSHEMHSFGNIESVQEGLEKTLLNVSCEFTSLEESGLYEYIQSIPKLLKYLKSKQIEFTEVLLTIFSQLIENNDDEKLYRLMLTLINNCEAMELFAFNASRGPLDVIEKLIVFLDSSEWGADDDNFQESYTHFGVILLGIISMINIFALDFSQVLVKTSFTSDYINNFFYRLCDNLSNKAPTTTEEEATIVQNYNSLCADWINALFDDANDGLPDDLIRAVHVKQIYKLIPIVFQQAVTATISKTINLKILTNGTDYLSQPFLIPTMLSIIKWLLSRIETVGLEEIYLQTLYELVKANCRSENEEAINESFLTFRGVLLLVGHDIVVTIKKFSQWRENEVAAKTCALVSSCITIRPTAEDKSQILSETDMGDQLKNSILKVVKGEDEQLETVASIIQRIETRALINYLESEIAMYEKSVNNSEDIRVFVHLIVFLQVTNTIKTNSERSSWLAVYENNADKKSYPSEFDSSFSPSLEWHYSSIFNSNTDHDMDDDLFMEDVKNENNKMLTSIVLEQNKSADFLYQLLIAKNTAILRFLHDFTKDEIKTFVTGTV